MNNELRIRAAQLLRTGRNAEAISAYRAIVAETPDAADAWFNLGYLQRRAGAYGEALDAYERAILSGLRAPEEAHVNRAAILSDHLARTDLAVAEFEAAIALRPGYWPALFNLANLHEDMGHADEARRGYEAALGAAPGDAATIARLAMLDIHAGAPADAVTRIEHRLRERSFTPEEEAELRYALARAHDSLSDAASAWTALERANAISRAAARAAGYVYDRKRHEALVAALIDTFPVAATARRNAGEAPPIFVCGLYRSGSTLVEQILAAHSRVTNGGELDILPRLVGGALQPYPASLGAAASGDLDRLRTAYIAELDALFPGHAEVTDKRPDNFLHIGLIRTLFPEARIVHTVRGSADNALAIYFMNFQHSVTYGFDLADVEHWMAHHRRLMAYWRTQYPGAIFDLEYERLVADPEPTIRALLAHLDLPFEPPCLSPHTVANHVRTASVLQVREPLHARASGRSGRYAAFLPPELRAKVA